MILATVVTNSGTDTGTLLAIVIPLLIAIVTGVWILGAMNATVKQTSNDTRDIKTKQAAQDSKMQTVYDDVAVLKNDVRQLQTDVAHLNTRDGHAI